MPAGHTLLLPPLQQHTYIRKRAHSDKNSITTAECCARLGTAASRGRLPNGLGTIVATPYIQRYRSTSTGYCAGNMNAHLAYTSCGGQRMKQSVSSHGNPIVIIDSEKTKGLVSEAGTRTMNLDPAADSRP